MRGDAVELFLTVSRVFDKGAMFRCHIVEEGLYRGGTL